MSIKDYKYTVDQCDVPDVRRGALREYRAFRRVCVERLRGPAPTSITNQVHGLAWQTAVFRTLNEARRLEPARTVSGAMWQLTTAGYANLMTLGIRRLVDRHPDTNSVWTIIDLIERRSELLTRENFICFDGVPFDPKPSRQRYLDSLDLTAAPVAHWLETEGPEAWSTSETLHKAFDTVARAAVKPKRLDKISPSILGDLRRHLETPAIQKVCTMADKRVAHAERLAERSDAASIATYNEIDEALRQVVRVANFLSTHVLYDAAFGSVVPTPQFDVLKGLDEPWVTTENLPNLYDHWRTVSEVMDQWAYRTSEGFLT